MKRNDDALKDLNKLADILYKQHKVDISKVYLERAAIYHDRKQFLEAIEDCKRVLSIPKAQEGVRKNADSLMKWCQVGMQKEVLLGIVKSVELMRIKDLAAADKELSRVAKFDPNSTRILVLQSGLATLQKDFAKAESKAKEALKVDPKDGKVYLALSDLYFAQAKFDLASESLAKAMDLGTRSAEIYELRGLSYLLDGRPEKAMGDFNEILRLRPKQSSALMLRGICSIIKRDANQLITDGKSVMDNEGLASEKGIEGALLAYDGLLRSDRKEDATRLLDECLEKCAKEKWPHPLIQYLKGDIDGDTLLKAAQSLSEKTQAHAWLGLSALRKDDKDKAQEELSWCRHEGDTKQLSYVLLAAALVTPKVEAPAIGLAPEPHNPVCIPSCRSIAYFTLGPS